MNLHKEVENKIEELQKYALKTWNVNVKVTIEYSLNSSLVLGTCRKEKEKIILELNNNLLNEYKSLYIKEIVQHEFAHAVIINLFPRGMNGHKKVRTHGKEFKAVCSHFGIDGKATNDKFNDSTTLKKSHKQKRYTYYCQCGECELSTTRHNRIVKGTAKYRCHNCHTELKSTPYNSNVA